MSKSEILTGSNNVFADLGLPNPVDRQTKTRLAMALNRTIKDRGLKQKDVAALLGIPQPKVSALVNYKLDGFSVERLIDFLTGMGRNVEIMVRPCADPIGHVRVLEAA